MLGFCVLAPLGDSIAKILGGTVPIVQLLAARFVIQVCVLSPIVMFTGRTLRMGRREYILTFWRTIFHIAGVAAMFLSLRYLPLADAIAIAFVMPFILLVLGRTILNEHVGGHRLAACIVGFTGTLLVIQPNFANVGWPALLPLIVAVVFAFFIMVTRQLAKRCDPIAMQASSGVMATIILLPVWFIGNRFGVLGFDYASLDINSGVLLLALGLLGTFAHLLMTWSLRYAAASSLAPMQYLEIPVATVFGWLIFRDFPNGLAAVGIIITIGAGLYVIHRERVIARPVPALPL